MFRCLLLLVCWFNRLLFTILEGRRACMHSCNRSPMTLVFVTLPTHPAALVLLPLRRQVARRHRQGRRRSRSRFIRGGAAWGGSQRLFWWSEGGGKWVCTCLSNTTALATTAAVSAAAAPVNTNSLGAAAAAGRGGGGAAAAAVSFLVRPPKGLGWWFEEEGWCDDISVSVVFPASRRREQGSPPCHLIGQGEEVTGCAAGGGRIDESRAVEGLGGRVGFGFVVAHPVQGEEGGGEGD